MRWLLSASLVVTITCQPTFAQESVVREVKSQLEAQGVPLFGACGAFRITNTVARQIGAKLLSKAGGNRAVPQPDGTCLTGEQTSEPGYADGYLILLPSGTGVQLNNQNSGGELTVLWTLVTQPAGSLVHPGVSSVQKRRWCQA